MDHEGQEGQEEDGMNDANIDENMIVVCPASTSRIPPTALRRVEERTHADMGIGVKCTGCWGETTDG